MHTIELDHPVLEPDEGLLLGNGDLSVSIYQKPGRLVWRFGKNDVWDRRLDLDACPPAAHIDEISRGIRDEGWVSHSYVEGRGEATRGSADPRRMKELCDGWPAYARRPYPCPKPVGELAMHLPVDQRGQQVCQRLHIEEARVEVEFIWEEGVRIRCRCFVPPAPNVLAVHWEVENWTDRSATGRRPPVWFSLYRWADPAIEEFAAELFARSRMRYFEGVLDAGEATPLPPPAVRRIEGRAVVEQTFHPDLRFAEGFRYALAPFVTGLRGEPVEVPARNEACLHLYSDEDVDDGWLAVSVTTSTDPGGMEAELGRVSRLLEGDPAAVMQRWARDNEAAAAAFWKRSAVAIEDALLENTWYETLHVRRCTNRADVIAPGLALPSTVRDYSLWHGDYHTNYNYQSPFWGDYAANHPDLAGAFFPGMKYMVELGRKLARDYWNCRGTFIHLVGYPFETEGDPYGSGGLCRLAYMTGWIANHYWWRYLYTRDLRWLRAEGYPVMRDCALFYLDFLEKGDDGFYHAFPSGQGEYAFTGRPEDYTDQPQVVRHARYCLQCAAEAAGLLGLDEDLQGQWAERLDHLVAVDDLDELGFSAEEKRRYRLNPPEFTSWDSGSIPRPGAVPAFLDPSRSNALWLDYFGQFPWCLMIHLRNRVYDPERDLDAVRASLRRWRMPNGVLQSMAAGNNGFMGAYLESTGILGPLQEMMLQSWDGAIRLFPSWPRDLACSFRTLRAEGAFLVSASWRGGRVESAAILSECGGRCCVASPWPEGVSVAGADGAEVEIQYGSEGIACFETAAGGNYRLTPASIQPR